MSVRAYRVKEIVHNETPSFNVWHDEDIVRILGVDNQLGESGGVAWVSVKRIEDVLSQAKKLGIHKDTIKALKADLADARKQDNDGVEYYCF